MEIQFYLFLEPYAEYGLFLLLKVWFASKNDRLKV